MELLSHLKRSAKSFFLRRFLGYKNISYDSIIEGGVILDRVYPDQIYIAPGCLVARGAVILSHEHVFRDSIDGYPKKYRTSIGSNTFIGINAIICPGVEIGSSSIIGAGSVVTKSMPSNCVIAGNPAKVIRRGINLVHGARES